MIILKPNRSIRRAFREDRIPGIRPETKNRLGLATLAALAPIVFAGYASAGSIAGSALPGGFVLEAAALSNSQNRMVFNGPDACISGIGINRARFGRLLTTESIALLVEGSSTNLVPNSRNLAGTGWSVGATTDATYATTAPDGASTVGRQIVGANVVGRGALIATSPVTVGITFSSSMMTRRLAGAGSGNGQVILGNTTPIGAASLYVATEQWARRNLTYTTTGTLSMYLWTAENENLTSSGGGSPGATDLLYDLHQVEQAKFSTSHITTVGAAATRPADHLYHPNVSQLMSGGRLALKFRLRPLGNSVDYPAHMYLFYKDASNYAYIDYLTRKVVMLVSGVSYTSDRPLLWLANDVIEVYLAVGGGQATRCYWQNVTRGILEDFSDGAVVAALPWTGNVDFLCQGTSNTFSAFCESITPYGTVDPGDYLLCWHPLKLGAKLHALYRADSNANAGAGLVSQIDDLSGNGRHFVQASGSLKPVYNPKDVIYGGMPSIKGDGIDDFMTSALSFSSLALKSNVTVVVAPYDGSSTAQGMPLEYSNSGAANAAFLFIVNDTAIGRYNGIMGPSSLIETGVSEPLSTVKVITTDYDRTLADASAQIKFRVNSVAQTGIVATAGAKSGNFGNFNLNIFARNGSTFPWSGRHTVVALASDLTTDEKIKLEKYVGAFANILL